MRLLSGTGYAGRAATLLGVVATLTCGALAAGADGPPPSAHPVRTGPPGARAPRPPHAGWVWPLAGRHQVTRGFQAPETAYGPGHRGVDIAGDPGQAVRAAGAGRVGFAAVFAGRGVVTVHHPGGLETTYEPVSALVRAGHRVSAGEIIGRLEPGHEGCPVPACLHWGLRRGPVYLDPLLLVGRLRVRLLPLRGPPWPGPRHSAAQARGWAWR